MVFVPERCDGSGVRWAVSLNDCRRTAKLNPTEVVPLFGVVIDDHGNISILINVLDATEVRRFNILWLLIKRRVKLVANQTVTN